MLKNYLKIAFRNIRKEKLYSTLNILGLAIGLACTITILLFIQKELSFDQFHENKDRIYRVSQSFQNPSGWLDWVLASAPIGAQLASEIPEIEKVVTISGSDPNTIVKKDNIQFLEDRFSFANPELFDVFNFTIKTGNPQESLSKPFNLFISESMAQKYFPYSNPLGETLLIDNEYEYTVTGIFEDFPDNSHFSLDFIASYITQINTGEVNLDNWMGGGAYTYVLINKNTNQEMLEAQLANFWENHDSNNSGVEQGNGPQIKLKSTPLNDIHLYSKFDNEQMPQGDIRYIYIFSAIALLILLIASINYVNMATARATNRSKEVGVRKTSGASRFELIRQYLGESYITTFLALLISVILVELALPSVNNLLSRSLNLTFTSGFIILTYLVLWLVTGLFSGIYPALFLSKFKPVEALKSGHNPKSKAFIRKGLITFQLGSAVALLICTIVIQRQMNLIQEMNPGFDEEQVLMLPNMQGVDADFNTLKTELESIPGVLHVTTNSYEPGIAGGLSAIDSKDIEGSNKEGIIRLNNIYVGYDFEKTFGLDIIEGRPFDNENLTELGKSILINESAVKNFGWENPVGKTLDRFGKERVVIGVLEDFPTSSIKEKIQPTIIYQVHNLSRLVAIRVAPNSIQQTIKDLEQKWASVLPTIPFSFQFLDDQVDALYRSEVNLAQFLTIFCFFAILVACFGLVGLSAYSAQQRTKEIGIRKVIGASIRQILALLTMDIFKWYLVGLLVAIPVASYVMNSWLSSFEYIVKVDVWTYLVTIVVSLSFVIFSVSYQAIKVATANPVDSLKSE